MRWVLLQLKHGWEFRSKSVCVGGGGRGTWENTSNRFERTGGSRIPVKTKRHVNRRMGVMRKSRANDVTSDFTNPTNKMVRDRAFW